MNLPYVALVLGTVTSLLFIGQAMGIVHTAEIAVEPEKDLSESGVFGHLHLQGGQEDGTKFITAGEPGYRSQSIVAAASVHGDGSVLGWQLCQYRYRVYVNNAEAFGLASMTYDFAQPGSFYDTRTYALTSYTFSLVGPATGAVRVELEGFIGTGIHRAISGCDSWKKLAVDGAQLLDGAGALTLRPGQSDVFEEGDTVTMDVRTGEGRWYVQVFDGAGNVRSDVSARTSFGSSAITAPSLAVVFLPNGCWYDTTTVSQKGYSAAQNCPPPTSASQPAPGGGPANTVSWDGSKSGAFTWKVPVGAFVPGGNNVWKVVMKNTFIDHATERTAVVDKKIYAPEPPVVNASPQHPNVGEPLTLSMTSRANPSSGASVASFYVYAWYGSTILQPTDESPSWIARGITVPASSAGSYGYTATYTFPVQRPDIIQYRVFAVDSMGRPSGSTLSGTDKASLSVQYNTTVNDNSRGEVHPQGSDHAAGPQFPVAKADSATTFLILALVIVVVLAVWLWVPLPLPGKIVVMALVVGVGTYSFMTKMGWW